MIINKLSIKSDAIGAVTSSICLLHCIATPIIFIIHPLSNNIESAPIWWKSLDYALLLLSFFAVYWSARNTSKNWIKYLFWMSWSALTIAILNEKLEVFSLPELTVYIPAIALIFLHLYNKKYCLNNNEKRCTTN